MEYVLLSCGDVIVDTLTKETGLLVMRFDVMAAYDQTSLRPVWAWDILWAGTRAITGTDRRSAYTEEGLVNMIKCGTFMHVKSAKL